MIVWRGDGVTTVTMIRAVPRLLTSLLALAGLAGARHNYGLTAYGEPCTDSCKQRGFPYAWCHKKPSWNGTYLSKAGLSH